MKQSQVCMSKRGSYLGGHSIFTIKKKNKSKATTGSIIKSKRRWPYKTVRPDSDLLDLTPNDKLILKHLKTALVINDRRIRRNSDKDNPDSKLLEKLLIEKSNIEKLIKKSIGNIKSRTHNKRRIRKR